jgi:hypothetical protein
MPNMDDILKQNPDLAKQFAAAAAQQAGPGFGNFMGMAMNGGVPQAQQSPAQFGQNPTGQFFGSSQQQAMPMAQTPQNIAAVEPPKQTARREMRGPSGVDDILRQFEQARQEEQQAPQNVSQPAVSAAIEIQSMASEDIGSTTESRAGGRRGRRRQAVGNTVSLNV